MCGILGVCCGNASKACHCCSLRTFAFTWLGITIVIALVQFIAGAYLSSYLAPVDAMLKNIKDRILQMDDPTTALKYYGIIADSLASLWKGMSLLTTTRGVFDTVAAAVWAVGWVQRRPALLYAFVGLMAADFAVDLCLFVASLALVNALYVAYFFPIALLLPFLFYGWQMLLGPYIVHLLLSHAYGTDSETARLLDGDKGKKTEKEIEKKETDKKGEKEEDAVIIDDDVMAEAVEEV